MNDLVARGLPRRTRAWVAAIACALAVTGVTGCGDDGGPQRALDGIAAPGWFTKPADSSAADAEPPRWNRTYHRLPRGQSDVELAYSQALDRAGWRFHASARECADAGAPRGGRIKDNCWVNGKLLLGFVASHDGGGASEDPPIRLDVVVHRAAD